jgi:hypothetical protein
MTARSLALSEAAADPGVFGQHRASPRDPRLTARHHGWSMLSAVSRAG